MADGIKDLRKRSFLHAGCNNLLLKEQLCTVSWRGWEEKELSCCNRLPLVWRHKWKPVANVLFSHWADAITTFTFILFCWIPSYLKHHGPWMKHATKIWCIIYYKLTISDNMRSKIISTVKSSRGETRGRGVYHTCVCEVGGHKGLAMVPRPLNARGLRTLWTLLAFWEGLTCTSWKL